MITKRVAHICVLADDLAASEHFYCTVLGMDRGFDFLKDGELFGFYAKAGNDTYIEIFKSGAEINRERPLVLHLCLEVEDIDAAIATVRARGWEIGDKKFGGDNSWQAWLKDPAGLDIELMQYTPESSQFTGKPCIVSW